MLLKQSEYRKIDLNKSSKILFYGINEGLKNETIKYLTENKEIFIYDEIEILKKYDDFIESISTKSFFEIRKIILIRRSSEKIYKLIEEIDKKKN